MERLPRGLWEKCQRGLPEAVGPAGLRAAVRGGRVPPWEPRGAAPPLQGLQVVAPGADVKCSDGPARAPPRATTDERGVRWPGRCSQGAICLPEVEGLACRCAGPGPGLQSPDPLTLSTGQLRDRRLEEGLHLRTVNNKTTGSFFP